LTPIHIPLFDTVVAYDGGADHVIGHANVTPDNVAPLVAGIFSRARLKIEKIQLFLLAVAI
jgi:hypothetical protein